MIKQCERKLMSTLVEHLERVMDQANTSIHEKYMDTLQTLKRLDPSNAECTITDTLKEVHLEYQNRTEQRNKKRKERETNSGTSDSKKAKLTDK